MTNTKTSPAGSSPVEQPVGRLLDEAKELSMELTMSMFATQADYWKARAELAETTVRETAEALGCDPDNETILSKIDELRNFRAAGICVLRSTG